MRFDLVLERVARALDSLGILYMVIGGQAALVHGHVRLTQDIDITLGIPPFDPAPLLRLSEMSGLETLVSNPKEFLAETFVLPVRDRETGIRVDLICSLSEYEQQAIARAVTFSAGSVPVRYIGLEDLIVHKIIAGRPRDFEDVRALLVRHAQANIETIRGWLREQDGELDSDFEERFNAVLGSLSRG